MEIRRSPRKYLQHLLKFVIQIEQQVFEIMTLFKNELTKGVFNFVIILVENAKKLSCDWRKISARFRVQQLNQFSYY